MTLPLENNEAAASTGASLWPKDFATPRESALAMFCVAAWGAILSVLAAGNHLLPLKQALLVLAGARLQPLLSAEAVHSMDIAVVLFGATLVIAGGYIHVSVGLAVVLAFRPWLDGFTYPTDNTYFLWAIFYLTALWGLRQYRNPQVFRGGWPLLLLGLYLLYGALGLSTSIQPSSTYTDLFLWVGYAALLLTVMNGVQSREARGVVLFGIVVGVSGQALFAYPHLSYVLPWLRNQLQTNPEMLAQWFQGATEFTPELARRFNLNRAFGSMVFPNALAALMILGIPVTLAVAVDSWRNILQHAQGGPKKVPGSYRSLIALSVPLFALVALVVYAAGLLGLVYQIGAPPFFGTSANLRILCVVAAILPTLAFLLVGRARGLSQGLQLIKALATSLLAPIMVGALWISYSRGAMIALLLSVLVAIFFNWAGPDFKTLFSRLRMGRVVAILTIIAGLATVAACSGSTSEASSAADAAPGAEVLPEGMDVSMADLANPASFSARLGYWRVALRIAATHPLMGVGLGNFGIAYGPAQDIGAGDVRNAHCVILQNLCEVGVPGLILFLSFWVLLIWGGLQSMGQRPFLDHVIGWGLLAGLLAFLLHAVIDINFSHPSLVMMAMAVTGLFYQDGGIASKSPRLGLRRGGAIALMLGVTLAAGLCMRPYFQALGLNGGRFINVSQRNWLGTRQQAAVFFLSDCPAWAIAGKEGTPPRIPVMTATCLFPDRAMIFTLGRVIMADPVRRVWVEISPDQALPPNSILEIERPWDAQFYAVERLERWLVELIYLDARFPHDADLALSISRVYRLLYDHAQEKQAGRKPEYLAGMLQWSENAVARSPLHKDMYQHRAWVKWTVATQRSGPARIAAYRSALDDFRRSQDLGHLEPGYYFAHAGALSALAQSYENQGSQAEAATYRAEAAEIRQIGRSLQETRWARGLQ